MTATYIRSDSSTPRRLSDEALRLHSAASRWVKRNRTRILPTQKAYALHTDAKHLFRTLLDAGLWEPVSGGYQIGVWP